MKILVLNAGSSSQKICLYEIDGNTLPEKVTSPLWEASADFASSEGNASITIKIDKSVQKEDIPFQSRTQIIAHLLGTLWQDDKKKISSLHDIDVVGHRVVHGGREYRESVRVDSAVKAAIARLSSLAPLHNPANLEGIQAIEEIIGEYIPQVAVFDTAFHSHLPETAAVYPIPYTLMEQGIRRYGFHGISHQYCSERAAQLLQCDLNELRLIICHLGNGASLAAVRDGHSVDTTMGFTPLDGLMMGSRCGAIDPGILIYLLRQGYSVEQIDQACNYDSGLKGISGVSSDLRLVLKASASGNERAKLAFGMYIHHLRSYIGSMLMSLSRLDALVFTAGIGENSALVRSLACDSLDFLGLKIDPKKNELNPVDQDISTSESTVKVLVLHTEENWAIACNCWKLLHSGE